LALSREIFTPSRICRVKVFRLPPPSRVQASDGLLPFVLLFILPFTTARNKRLFLPMPPSFCSTERPPVLRLYTTWGPRMLKSRIPLLAHKHTGSFLSLERSVEPPTPRAGLFFSFAALSPVPGFSDVSKINPRLFTTTFPDPQHTGVISSTEQLPEISFTWRADRELHPCCPFLLLPFLRIFNYLPLKRGSTLNGGVSAEISLPVFSDSRCKRFNLFLIFQPLV